jgi:hypothetical protein
MIGARCSPVLREDVVEALAPLVQQCGRRHGRRIEQRGLHLRQVGRDDVVHLLAELGDAIGTEVAAPVLVEDPAQLAAWVCVLTVELAV